MKNNFNTITPEKEYHTHLTPSDEYNNSNSGGLNNWTETTLGEISITKQYGYTESATLEIVGPKFLRITDIQDDFINWETVPYCPISKTDYKKYKLEIGDIVIARTGNSTGATAVIKEDNDAVFASYLIRFKLDPNIANFKFIDFLLRSDFWKSFVKSIKGGSAQGGANANNFAEFPIHLPPIEEQKAIASVLSAFDDKIELLREQNMTLEELGQTIFQEWFGKYSTDRPEELPEGWRIGKLGDMMNLIESGSRPKGGIDPNLKFGIPSVGAESINGIGNYNFDNTKYITEEYFLSMNRGHVKDYDVLIYKDGAYVGKKAMYGNGFPFETFAINEHVFILRCLNLYDQFFLYFYLKQDELALLNTNSAQPGLNQESMKLFKVIFPPEINRCEFGLIIKEIVDKILFNNTQIQSLSHTRDELLPRLMRGELRVGGF